MNIISKISVLFVLACIYFTASAQTTEPSGKDTDKSKSRKDESIIIRKKGNAEEKMTIVIDGDKMTINGKPAEDFNGDVNVIRSKTLKSTFPPLGNLRERVNVIRRGADGNPNRTYLGVQTMTDDSGVSIKEVIKESPAEKAGLKENDVITKINDTLIDGSRDLYQTIGKYQPEDKIKITYLRDGKEAVTTATLVKNSRENNQVMKVRPHDDDFNFNFNDDDLPFGLPPGFGGIGKGFRADNTLPRKPKIGLQVQDIESGKGVKVIDTGDDSPAAKAGLIKDDIITTINGDAVTSVDEVREQLSEAKEGDTIKINLLRGTQKKSVEIKLPKKLKTATL